MAQIKTALISVYDKTGLVPFAKMLSSQGVLILSTGGTAKLLRKSGVRVRDVSAETGFPEMLDGRVKTLHPRIHAGLLARRGDPEHLKTLERHKIRPIDLVVVNLYPFWDAVKNGSNENDVIEMIDIGGPTMLRSAAKNFEDVAVVCDPSDYGRVASELTLGELSGRTRRELAAKVFRLTSWYDSLVQGFLGRKPGEAFGPALSLHFEKAADLRYGENPHQKAAVYRTRGGRGGVVGARQLQGKELSFNNYLDLDAASEMAFAFDGSACAIVKHTSPCGFAVARDAVSAFRLAHKCDPLSAFGGIVGFNVRVDGKTAKAVLASGFLECVIAPSFSREALAAFSAKKNLRVLELPRRDDAESDFKRVSGGILVQDRDLQNATERDLKVVTRKKPSAGEIKDLLFAFRVCRYAKSNAIVVARGGATLGLGMGQPSRVDSCRTALSKAGKAARGAVLASDGFFPKSDSIELAAKAGIRAVIQPGGSIQDAEIVRACDEAGIAMVFSGIRHFRH